jgi:negative regulator of genetic competence, sporulation and motility
LDFRELKNILVFPKQVQFTSLEQSLYTLKDKYVQYPPLKTPRH